MPCTLSLRRTLAALCLSTPALTHAQETPKVARVEIAGSHQMPDGSYLFYVSTKPGDAYDDLRLRGDFRRLWETGFLDDLRLEVTDAPEGKVVTFRVAERARVRVVDFRGSKQLSDSTIAERLKQEDASLAVDHFFDRERARRAEGIVKRMLGEKATSSPACATRRSRSADPASRSRSSSRTGCARGCGTWSSPATRPSRTAPCASG